MIKINDTLVVHYSGYELVGRVRQVLDYGAEIVVDCCTELCNGRPASKLLPGELFMCKPSEIIMNRTAITKSVADLDLL